MVIEAAGPAVKARLLLTQSRTTTLVTVIVPTPSAPAFLTATLNSVPEPAVAPQGSPRMAASTVYEPPPLLRTWNAVAPIELRYVPSVMLESPAHRARLALSWNVTLTPRMLSPAPLAMLRATGTQLAGEVRQATDAGTGVTVDLHLPAEPAA